MNRHNIPQKKRGNMQDMSTYDCKTNFLYDSHVKLG